MSSAPEEDRKIDNVIRQMTMEEEGDEVLMMISPRRVTHWLLEPLREAPVTDPTLSETPLTDPALSETPLMEGILEGSSVE